MAKKKKVTFSSPIITSSELPAIRTANTSPSDANTEGESTDCESTKSETPEAKEQQKNGNNTTSTGGDGSSRKSSSPPSSAKVVKKAANRKELLALMALITSMQNTSSSSSSPSSSEDKDEESSGSIISSCSSSSASTSDSDAAKRKGKKNNKSALKRIKKIPKSASPALLPSSRPGPIATLTNDTLNLATRPSFTQVYKSSYPYQIKLRPTRHRHHASSSLASSHSSSDNESQIHSGSAEVTWTKEDCTTLAILEARQRSLKWLDLQAEFYNLTGKMIDAEDLREKFETDAAIMDAKADRRENKFREAAEEEQVEKEKVADKDVIVEEQIEKKNKKKKDVFDETDELMTQAIKAMADLAAN